MNRSVRQEAVSQPEGETKRSRLRFRCVAREASRSRSVVGLCRNGLAEPACRRSPPPPPRTPRNRNRLSLPEARYSSAQRSASHSFLLSQIDPLLSGPLRIIHSRVGQWSATSKKRTSATIAEKRRSFKAMSTTCWDRSRPPKTKISNASGSADVILSGVCLFYRRVADFSMVGLAKKCLSPSFRQFLRARSCVSTIFERAAESCNNKALSS